MNTTPPSYLIAKVGDFLKVPADRRAACLADCARMLDDVEALGRLTSVVAESMAAADGVTLPTGGIAFDVPEFTWVDDHRRGGVFDLTRIMDGSEAPQ